MEQAGYSDEGDPSRARAVARRGRAGGRRDRRREPSLGAASDRLEPRRLGERQALRLGLRRLRRGRRRRAGARSVRDRRAQAALVRNLRRGGLGRRIALRGGDRRLPRAPRVIERLLELQRGGGRGVLMTVLAGDAVGSKLLVLESGEAFGDGPADLADHAPALIRGARNTTLDVEGRTVFAEVYVPPPRLFVYGAVDLAEALSAAAKHLGWTAIVADARPRFATRERMPSADELVVAWPQEAFAQVAPDHATAVVILTHDDKFDLPALELALASGAFYIGLIGGRRNQERKRERLREAGLDEAALERVSGPAGLDLGAESVPETALSILAEALAARNGRFGGPLQAKQRAHAEAP